MQTFYSTRRTGTGKGRTADACAEGFDNDNLSWVTFKIFATEQHHEECHRSSRCQRGPDSAQAQEVKRDIPYTKNADKLQTLDVYSPSKAKNLPVVFWIHGGGWQAGDKSEVYVKPQVFNGKGFIFVSTNYRLLPKVDMATLTRDVAKSIRWVHDHIAEYGGDPKRLLIMGHSAGAQLAALLCTDERYLKEEGLSFAIIKGCVPVDGDTYDIPAMIEVAETALSACMVCRCQNSATASSLATTRPNTRTSPR